MGRPAAAAATIRVGLIVVATTPAFVGAWAAPAPRSFYDDFPAPGRDWVSALGPYDEHLVRDVGELNLALAFLLLAAAVVLERRLVRIALVAWLIYAVPHLAFHLTALEPFGAADAAANVGGLALIVVVPFALLALSGRLEPASGAAAAAAARRGPAGGVRSKSAADR